MGWRGEAEWQGIEGLEVWELEEAADAQGVVIEERGEERAVRVRAVWRLDEFEHACERRADAAVCGDAERRLALDEELRRSVRECPRRPTGNAAKGAGSTWERVP